MCVLLSHVYNICVSFVPPPSSSLLKKNLIVNCKILISHFRKFNFLGSIVRFMLCFLVRLHVCVLLVVLAVVKFVIVLCVCVDRSFVGDCPWPLSSSVSVSGIFFFVGSVLFIVGKLYEAFCAKLCLCNSG